MDKEGFPRWCSGIESATNAGDAGDEGSIPWSGRFPGRGNATHSSILAWRIPWTEKPGGPQSWGRRDLDTTEHARTHMDSDK